MRVQSAGYVCRETRATAGLASGALPRDTRNAVAYRHAGRFDGPMAPRFLTILTGRNLPKIRQAREPEPSTINEKTIADFTRVVEQTGISARGRAKVQMKEAAN